MAKHLFLLAVGALALTACTSESVIDDEVASRNLITFDNVVNKPSRAAVDLDNNSLTQFNVFGFYTMPEAPEHAHAVFNNVPVTKQGGVWGYDTKYDRFWLPGATYYFYAYSCGSSDIKAGMGKFTVDMETGDKPASQRVLQIDDYVCDYTHQHDLIFASETGYTAGATNGAVQFQFKHILSKLTARFTNSFSSEYDVVVKKVIIDDICNYGDYDFLTGWQDVRRPEGQEPLVFLLNPKAYGDSPADAPITIESKNNPSADPDKLLGESMAAYVIPKDYTSESVEKVYLNITIDLKYGDDIVIKDKQLRAVLNPNWQEGYAYIYNIDLNASTINLNKIEFTLDEIKDWGNGGESDATLEK